MNKNTEKTMAPGMSRFRKTPSSFFRKLDAGMATKPDWDKFALHYWQPLAHYGVTRVGISPNDIEDVVQNVFAALWRCPKTIRRHPNSYFRVWLVRVLQNKHINVLRDEARKTCQPDDAELLRLEAECHASDEKVRRALRVFLREDLYGLLKTGKTPDTRLCRRDYAIWLERTYHKRPRAETAAKYGLCTDAVTDIVAKIDRIIDRNRDMLYREYRAQDK